MKSWVTGAMEMAQQVKYLLHKPDNLSSVPGTHMGEGKDPTRLSYDPYMLMMACPPPSVGN